ncbi:unnamed protein product, partial [Adineta steineri]
VDQYSTQKENPLVLMAQACNNIGKVEDARRFKDFFPSCGEIDFRCLDINDDDDDGGDVCFIGIENSFPILLHA